LPVQFRFVRGGNSDPRGPGMNAAGLGLFRYQTRCGTVYGHTGSIHGYTQLIAATRDGRTSVTFTINTQVSDAALPTLRRAQELAVCVALRE
jgi:D-alanyl-D-alanine carboxypeptidase